MGVSIDGGAQFTNEPDVDLHLVWPFGEWTLLAANDGGFSNTDPLPLQPIVSWRLTSSGPERLPKTVYVRYGNSSLTFQDDIILDETPPVLRSVTTSDGGASTAHAARAKRAYRLSITAGDGTSGVGSMQIAASKSKPGKWVTFRKRPTFRAAAAPWVRVRDRAGNPSRWRRAKTA